MTDTQAAHELELFLDNDYDLHRQQYEPILRNLATKKARKQYKHDLAVKLFGYLVEAGAKKYAKNFGSPSQPWHKMFDVPTRRAVAESLTRSFETEHALGNYDHLLPKKYQKQDKVAATGHARKKLTWKTPESLKITWSVPNNAYFALWPGRGPIKDQQVLKIASAEDMHSWLRDTYGDAYGIAGRTRASARTHHATISGRDIREFNGFLRNATDRQVQGIYDKEKRAGRDEYAELAIAEAERRGIEIDSHDHATISLGVHAHARRKSPARLDREIKHALSGRGGR